MCFLDGQISDNLINENCLPKLAEIWKNTNSEPNQSMKIEELGSDSDSNDSWSDSWSSE